MIDRAGQQALQQCIPAKQVEWSRFVLGRKWDTELLATEIAADAVARALGKAES